MRKYIVSSFLWRWSFAAFILAAPNLQGQTTVPYLPNLFDISISFGCDCTCMCETNTVHTNNPVSMFLAANPVTAVSSSTAVMPPAGQLVPPHWSEFTATCSPPSYGSSVTTFPPEGWTTTISSITPWGFANNVPVAFNLNYPIDFNYLDYLFYANLLSPTTSPGDQPIPAGASSSCQPYPWDVNLTLQLQNKQLYYMEQQLVVGYAPEVSSTPYETPVDYVETNSLLTITLYCTNNGVPYILDRKSTRL